MLCCIIRFFSCENAHCYEKCCLTKLLLQNFLNSSEMLKRAFPTFSESLKGVVTKNFSGGFAPRPPHFSTPVFSGWRRPWPMLIILRLGTRTAGSCRNLRKTWQHFLFTRGVHYIYVGYRDVPSGRVSIFQILV